MRTIGFIGTGNMGGALARAVVKGYAPCRILLANRGRDKAQALALDLQAAAESFYNFGPEADPSLPPYKGEEVPVAVEICDNARVAAEADYIFLGVKPQMMAGMMEGIAPILKSRLEGASEGSGASVPVLITMAAALTMEQISGMAGGSFPVIRIMPNTPVSVGKGVILYTRNALVTEDMLSEFLAFLREGGRLAPLPEHLIDAGSSVSGCGPAFVYMFIEALADGGVACGLPRRDAMTFAAQMVAGSAELVLSSGKHPGELKDAVCSPGGTTIQGVRMLEEAGFRGAVIDAVIAAYEKNKNF